ncbi:glycosyltransferase family A protein [Flavobacterium sp. LHD-80]|uniref:glycosyltransferase family 2 protein n=1 Tax=Flavobacterium sp. LHD-80 TaxID=3071411 RepID=UPI0027E0DE1C|nr:glycosyltransferase family A protein [Flavobacterium sp. LHD-80]MDQ6472082.1 glycosyltransferase family A protein [Flavobacterium sp. LHD-80]
MTKDKLISVIIPCYNQAMFLDETLNSVFIQTYENWECLVINDESTDLSAEIAQKWVQKDSRFKYFFKKNGGVSSARNLGLQNAKGDYIQFLDSDDLISNNKLELSLNAILNNNLEIVFTNFKMFTNNVQKPIAAFCKLKESLFTYDNLIYEWNESFSIPIQTALIEKKLLENIRFPEHMTAQEDWVFWVNVFKENPKIKFIDESLSFYRMNLYSRTMKDTLDDNLKAYDYFRNFLTENEFQQLTLVLIKRYFKSSSQSKKRIKDYKESNTYQTGLFVKKGLKIFGLLPLSRKIFPFILKLKSK